MFRLTEDEAVINRYGFNSEGKAAAAERLSAFWRRHGWKVATARAGDHDAAASERGALESIRVLAKSPAGILGVNLGKNKETVDAKVDYVSGLHTLAPYADYLVVNVSSPNTPGLRSLQGRTQLQELLDAVRKERDMIPWGSRPLVISSDEIQKGGDLSAARTATGKWRAASADEASLVFLRTSPPPLLVKIAPDVSEVCVREFVPM